jgi:transketolase
MKSELSERSKSIRLKTIDLSKPNGGYHYGGCFSAVEILISLFDHVLQKEDKFVMSKGHACWPYYVILQERGFKPLLEGHPHLDEENGVNYTTGSMGHGLPATVGMALARKVQDTAGRLYVLIGDGECQEGTTWESFLIAAHRKLDNLCVIVDFNRIQGSGFVSDILPIDALSATAVACGWRVTEVDGHNLNILNSLLSKNHVDGKPHLVIANTIKGKGVSFMENQPEWHAKWLDGEFEATARKELS